MDPEDIGSKAYERLQAAGLIPPVESLHMHPNDALEDADGEPWPAESEIVFVEVAGPITPELAARLRDALEGLPFEVRSAGPRDGVMYGGHSV